MLRPALVIHGGAGRACGEDSAARREGCRAALDAGWRILDRGGSALDAVCAAVVALENHPAFNAGTGSVLTAAGTVEMDASVMEGTQLRAGAVAVVRTVRNPILLARTILEAAQTVFLAGSAAEDLARQHGLEMCAPEDLVVPRQLERWKKGEAGRVGGTVGAVAVDLAGGVAAATSTGGMEGKPPGRIGDSAVIGAGTYADDGLGAVSATGHGEAIVRAALAARSAAALRGGLDPQTVAESAIATLQRRTGGKGGLIIVDPLGRIGQARNTEHMTVAWMRADRSQYAIDAAP